MGSQEVGDEDEICDDGGDDVMLGGDEDGGEPVIPVLDGGEPLFIMVPIRRERRIVRYILQYESDIGRNCPSQIYTSAVKTCLPHQPTDLLLPDCFFQSRSGNPVARFNSNGFRFLSL